MIGLLIGVLTIAGLALLFLRGRQHGKLSAHDQAEAKRAWHHIQKLMEETDEHAWVRAIFEADKLLEWALGQKGVRGKNLGEKLKNGAPLLVNLNMAWEAHKVRNRLAHERDVEIPER